MISEPPEFLLEMLSRWDFGWRLSQTKGPIMLPIPMDFHSTVEAIHHVKRLSVPYGSTLLVKITPAERDDPGRVVEIRHRPLHSIRATTV
jgi:hypothetical protein